MNAIWIWLSIDATACITERMNEWHNKWMNRVNEWQYCGNSALMKATYVHFPDHLIAVHCCYCFWFLYLMRLHYGLVVVPKVSQLSGEVSKQQSIWPNDWPNAACSCCNSLNGLLFSCHCLCKADKLTVCTSGYFSEWLIMQRWK